MRKVIVLGLLAVAVTFSGCKKYPEGPGFSLSSALKRFAQEWAFTNVKVNGFDATTVYQGSFLDIEDDGDYTLKTPLGNILGTWAFNDDKTEATFSEAATSQTHTLTILRLKKDELKTQEVTNNDTIVALMHPVE